MRKIRKQNMEAPAPYADDDDEQGTPLQSRKQSMTRGKAFKIKLMVCDLEGVDELASAE